MDLMPAVSRGRRPRTIDGPVVGRPGAVVASGQVAARVRLLVP